MLTIFETVAIALGIARLNMSSIPVFVAQNSQHLEIGRCKANSRCWGICEWGNIRFLKIKLLLVSFHESLF